MSQKRVTADKLPRHVLRRSATRDEPSPRRTGSSELLVTMVQNYTVLEPASSNYTSAQPGCSMGRSEGDTPTPNASLGALEVEGDFRTGLGGLRASDVRIRRRGIVVPWAKAPKAPTKPNAPIGMDCSQVLSDLQGCRHTSEGCGWQAGVMWCPTHPPQLVLHLGGLHPRHLSPQ